MKIGFLFPGQGAQFVGMGKDIFEKYEQARKIYNKVKDITNIDIEKISFEGPEETLNATRKHSAWRAYYEFSNTRSIKRIWH